MIVDDISQSITRVSSTSMRGHDTSSVITEVPEEEKQENEYDEEEDQPSFQEFSLFRHLLMYEDVLNHDECYIFKPEDFVLLSNGNKRITDYSKRCIVKTLFTREVKLKVEQRTLLWSKWLNIDPDDPELD